MSQSYTCPHGCCEVSTREVPITRGFKLYVVNGDIEGFAVDLAREMGISCSSYRKRIARGKCLRSRQRTWEGQRPPVETRVAPVDVINKFLLAKARPDMARLC